MLVLSMNNNDIVKYVDNQLSLFDSSESIADYLEITLDKCLKCFAEIDSPYYHTTDGKNAFFSPFQTAQYAQFLYYLSRTAYDLGSNELAAKIYCLNKMLHGVDWYYKTNLPSVFWADHPLSSVLGNAVYGDYFFVSQGCTVGNNHEKYPVIGSHVIMHPYSMIAGDCTIGDYVEISAYAFIRDANIPSDCIVFGQSPNLTIVSRKRQDMENRNIWFIK